MTESMFLSPAELVELTGYRQAAKQVAQLRAQRIPFHLNKAGHPVVVRVVWQGMKDVVQYRAASDARFAALLLAQKSEARAARAAKREAKGQKEKAARAVALVPVFRPPRRSPKSQSSAIRRARLRQCTPSWADRTEIRAVYAEARRLTEATGVVHHVDHHYPIAGRHVSGLHVHNNLQCLPAVDNKRKHNHFEAGA